MKVSYILLFILFSGNLVAQSSSVKYWLYYKDSDHQTVIDSIKSKGIKESYYSKWINASSIDITQEQAQFVHSAFPSLLLQRAQELSVKNLGTSDQEFSFALEQINAKAMEKLSINGKGVKIGIIDGGFLGAPKSKRLQHLFDKKLVIAYKDFITPKLKPYTGNARLDDQHGTEVWEMIAGKNPENGIQYGLATHAKYYVTRTDHGSGEKRIEEEYFIKALEWLHKKGVRLVNTSLGYTNGYDDPSENYTPEQMDGQTAIALASQYAIENKNMIIVAAAGNEGDSPWKVINTPADAKSVISVGASKNTIADKMEYSSIGPDFLNYLKPELTCYSSSGTSFSAPVITGLVACMLQIDPSLTSNQVRSILFQSCLLYPYGNNYIGYGNPNAEKIIQLLKGEKPKNDHIRLIVFSKRKFFPKQSYKIPSNKNSMVIFHKEDSWKVVQKELLLPAERKKIKIKRLKNASQTTVVSAGQVYEIFWN